MRPSASCTWSAQNMSPSFLAGSAGAPTSLPVLPLGLALPLVGVGSAHWLAVGLAVLIDTTRDLSSTVRSPPSTTAFICGLSRPARALQYRTFPLARPMVLLADGRQSWIAPWATQP